MQENLIKIRDKKIVFRKWKVKDRTKFLSSGTNTTTARSALVYDCLERKVPLSVQEFEFVLYKIRAASIKDEISWNFTCTKCSEVFKYVADLNKIMKPKFSEFSNISVKGASFKMGEIMNAEFYDSAVQGLEHEEALLIDFILHVHAYNGNDGLSFEEVFNIVNELDVSVFDDVLSKWNDMRFTIDNVEPVKCPKCGHKEDYEFDELPGFLPESWTRHESKVQV